MDYDKSFNSSEGLIKTNSYIQLKERIIIHLKKLRAYKNYYRKLSNDIQFDKNPIYYKTMLLPPKELSFAAMHDMTVPNDPSNIYIFIYILFDGTDSSLLVTTQNKQESIKVLNELFPKSNDDILHIHKLITDLKCRAVFSKKYIDSLSSSELYKLIDNPEFIDNGIIPIPIPNFLTNDFKPL
jgi:hypothetical protein